MAITATALRADIYRLLDEVLETGTPLEIERNGRVLRIVPAERRSLSELFPPRPELVSGDPGDLPAMDWSGEWKP